MADWQNSGVNWLDELYDLTARFPDTKDTRVDLLIGQAVDQMQGAKTNQPKHSAKLDLTIGTLHHEAVMALNDSLRNDKHYTLGGPESKGAASSTAAKGAKPRQLYVIRAQVDHRGATEYKLILDAEVGARPEAPADFAGGFDPEEGGFGNPFGNRRGGGGAGRFGGPGGGMEVPGFAPRGLPGAMPADPFGRDRNPAAGTRNVSAKSRYVSPARRTPMKDVSRQTVLLLVLVLLGGTAFGAWQFVLVPLNERGDTIGRLREDLEKKENERDLIVFHLRKNELDQRQMSLPADQSLAINEYGKLLQNLLLHSKLQVRDFKPGQPDSRNAPILAGKKPAYTRLTYSIQVRGDLYSLVEFMYGLYRQPLLHQIRKLNIQVPQAGANVRGAKSEDLEITMTIEALIIDKAENRSTLIAVPAQDGAGCRRNGWRRLDQVSRQESGLWKSLQSGIGSGAGVRMTIPQCREETPNLEISADRAGVSQNPRQEHLHGPRSPTTQGNGGPAAGKRPFTLY